jgi:hypothetical protein
MGKSGFPSARVWNGIHVALGIPSLRFAAIDKGPASQPARVSLFLPANIANGGHHSFPPSFFTIIILYVQQKTKHG